MKAQTDIEITLRSDPKLLRPLRRMVHRYVLNAGFSEQKADEVVLAVDEACANAIRHSYEGATDKKLLLSFRYADSQLDICVRDAGVPADVKRIARKPLRKPAKNRLTPGGLGLQFIYQVFDEVEFTPGKTQGNCLEMHLRKLQEQE